MVNFSYASNNEWHVPGTPSNFDLLKYLQSIAVDQNNNIYFGNYNNGVIVYKWDKWEAYFTQNSGIPSNDVYQVFFDRDNNLWCATGWGIGKFDGKEWITWNSTNSIIKDNSIEALCLDSIGGFWASNYYGIYHYDGKELNFKKFSEIDISAGIFTMSVDNKNQLWAGSFDGGLFTFNNENWSFINHNSYTPPLTTFWYNVRYITKDYLGNIWFTPNQGLAKYDGETYRLWDKERSEIPTDYIYCITADKENNIWIGSDSGLIKFDGKTFTTYNRTNSPMPSDVVYAIAIDSLGHKWLSCYLDWLGETRIAVFREGGTVFTTDVEDLATNIIFSIYPNPSSDKVLVSFTLNRPENIKLSLYNNLGIKLETIIDRQYQEGTYSETIDISKFASGMYFIRSDSGINNNFKKLFILK